MLPHSKDYAIQGRSHSLPEAIQSVIDYVGEKEESADSAMAATFTLLGGFLKVETDKLKRTLVLMSLVSICVCFDLPHPWERKLGGSNRASGGGAGLSHSDRGSIR